MVLKVSETASELTWRIGTFDFLVLTFDFMVEDGPVLRFIVTFGVVDASEFEYIEHLSGVDSGFDEFEVGTFHGTT